MPKFDLIIDPPLMNAAGSLGYAPEAQGPIPLAALGAFVTNPISQTARSPAHTPQQIAFPGGFLLHTGYPNPGLREAIRRYAQSWRRSPLPIVVHLLCQSPAEIFPMVSRLEGLAGIAGIELGLAPDVDIQNAKAFASTLTAAAGGEFPVVVRLPLERASYLATALAEFDLAAFSLGPPRGLLPGTQSNLVRGRLYGPGIFPLALAVVHDLKSLGIPIIGGGGVYRPAQVDAMLAAGAIAVQLDSVLWRGSWPPAD